MAGAVVDFNADSFQSDVLSGSGVVVVDFWAPWCGPCRLLSPVIDELATENEGKALIGKLNTDEQMATAQSQNISALPTVRIFKDGTQVETVSGVPSKDALQALIDKHVD